MDRALRSMIFLLLAASSAFAQAIIKIQVANNTVLVPVRVNDRDFNFLLDTGSEYSAIAPSTARQLGLAESGDVEILRNYRAKAARSVECDSLSIGNRVFKHEVFTILELDPTSNALGVPIDGVLGNDILQEFTFRLNYSKQELVSGPLSGFAKGGSAVALRRSGNQFFVPLRIISVPIELLLDSGANSTNLSWATWERLSRVWIPGSTVDGVVRAGFPAQAFFVCLPSVGLADTALRNQVVRIQRKVESGAFSADNFGGILGSELLRQFEVTFDLAHNRIFLQKDPQFKVDAYRYTTIGIQFAKDGDTGEYSVKGVWKNSPAEEAGIEIGDRIEAVNDQPAASLNTEEVARQLHGEEGTPMRLTLERGSVSSVVTMRTRRMLCGSPAPANSVGEIRKQR